MIQYVLFSILAVDQNCTRKNDVIVDHSDGVESDGHVLEGAGADGEEGESFEEFGTLVRPGPTEASEQEKDQHGATGQVWTKKKANRIKQQVCK